jgi:hypothetical protein
MKFRTIVFSIFLTIVGIVAIAYGNATATVQYYVTTTVTVGIVQGLQVVVVGSTTSTITNQVQTTQNEIITSVQTISVPSSTPWPLAYMVGVTLVIVAVISIFREIHENQGKARAVTQRRGVVCQQCGHRNPPFATAFCTNCGKAFSIDKQ